ncbi:hypothetical protein C8F04DRAFT_953189, partial [Mycena alexandri]
MLPHAPGQGGNNECYPLWLATGWSVMERVREARALWCTAVDQVTQTMKKSSASDLFTQRAEHAIQALEALPWDGNTKGFKASGPVDELALWFTTEWLNSDHEDQMLELLASDLGLTDGSTDCIQSSFFTQSLARAYSSPDEYRTDPGLAWLRRVGASFATKDRTRLGTITNKDENHWVTLGIDCEKEHVGYGDGFRGKPSPTLRKHLDWWLFEHLGAKFKWVDIPVAKQNDPHSCGILAYFDLAHWFDSERFLLPKCTVASMADERLKMFLRIVERHKEKTFVDEARDYEFTF